MTDKQNERHKLSSSRLSDITILLHISISAIYFVSLHLAEITILLHISISAIYILPSHRENHCDDTEHAKILGKFGSFNGNTDNIINP